MLTRRLNANTHCVHRVGVTQQVEWRAGEQWRSLGLRTTSTASWSWTCRSQTPPWRGGRGRPAPRTHPPWAVCPPGNLSTCRWVRQRRPAKRQVVWSFLIVKRQHSLTSDVNHLYVSQAKIRNKHPPRWGATASFPSETASKWTSQAFCSQRRMSPLTQIIHQYHQ